MNATVLTSRNVKTTQPIDMVSLYSKEQRPTWAGGTYNSSFMKSRAYDYEIMNTRGNGRDYEISLPRKLVGESALTGRYLY